MWQPIETAPKDRRFLAAYKAGRSLWMLEVCSYDAIFDCCVTSSAKVFPATHWREPPEPPAK